MLKLVFENNVFEYNKKYFKQISGIAMGAKCAPSIANLYLSILEENFLTVHRPLFYYRFIDDIFVIFDQLFNINLLTQNFKNLKLNVITEKSVIFLDLIIQLDQITGRFCTLYSDFLYFSRRLVSQLVNRGYNKFKTSKNLSNGL
jgi:hypothetical protein